MTLEAEHWNLCAAAPSVRYASHCLAESSHRPARECSSAFQVLHGSVCLEESSCKGVCEGSVQLFSLGRAGRWVGLKTVGWCWVSHFAAFVTKGVYIDVMAKPLVGRSCSEKSRGWRIECRRLMGAIGKIQWLRFRAAVSSVTRSMAAHCVAGGTAGWEQLLYHACALGTVLTLASRCFLCVVLEFWGWQNQFQFPAGWPQVS